MLREVCPAGVADMVEMICVVPEEEVASAMLVIIPAKEKRQVQFVV